MTNKVAPPSQSGELPPVERKKKKLTLLRRIIQRYQWMRLRNKIALWVFLLAIITAAVGYKFGRPAYRHFKSQMYLQMADNLVEAEDYNAASLAFRKAILSGNRNPEVWKRVAAFLEKINSPELGKIWETLAGLEPEVHEHKIRQAEALLRNGRGHQAIAILEALPPEAKETIAFHRISADIALSRRDYSVAREHYSSWLVLEPGNSDIEFRLLVTKMYSPDPLVAYPAKDEVLVIAERRGEGAAQAYRELVARSMQEGDVFDAARLASRLVELPEPKFEDMATFLNLEIASQSFALSLALERFLAFGKENPEELPKVANFLLERGQTDAVRKWLDTLPRETIEHQDVQTTRFQIALATEDWDAAFALLRENRLPVQVPPAVTELAEQAFAQYAAGDKDANQTWQRMVYMAQGDPGALQMLSLLAEARGWSFAVGRTLTALSGIATGNPDVWRRLARHEALTGNLAGYHSALAGLMRINPYDVGVSSDWVLSSVLLRKESPQTVLDIAERAYGTGDGANARVATSYAIALLGVNRPEDAKAAIEKMSPVDRRAPERAIYVGAVLASAGDHDEALEYLERAGNHEGSRFAEERGFRRIWTGIAKGEESASEQLDRIFADLAGWRQDSDRIADEMRQELEGRYDPAASQRILEDLRLQAQERRSSPAELQRLLQDLSPSEEAPTPNP